ncbi:MAG: glycosyltransferase family 39 protein [Verrucomicrobia bacterium]|nr:glycosyltransferase family 39 protein [Verrucomicrobiota bacterium]
MMGPHASMPKFDVSPTEPGGRSPLLVRFRAGWVALAVTALLAAYAAMAFTASLQKGQSFDEGQQLAVGYNLWLRGDYRIEGANGDLIKRWATLPYLITRPNFPGTDDPYWLKAEPYLLAHRFFFELGNRPEALLRQGRAMMVLMGVALGLLIFRCARELFGPEGGLVSLAVFAFSPHALAFGGIVSTDLSITLLLFAATWCIWRLLHEVTAGRVLASLGVFALLVLAKLTALVILPVTAVLLMVKYAAGGPLVVRWRGRAWTLARRRGQAAVFGALIVAHAITGWSAIWAHYGFRYRASPQPDNAAVELRRVYYRDGAAAPVEALVRWTRRTHFFPEGFRLGISRLLGSDDTLGSFMAGEWRAGGTPAFFPYAIWVKTRPALMLLLAAGVAGWWLARRSGRVAPALYAATPHLVLVSVYLAVAMTEDINLGHRHVLPIYPALDVLAGAVVLAWPGAGWWWRAAIGGLLLWMAGDSLAVRPDYLAFFGSQAGGPQRGYTHLVDSSLDWGMNLPGLKRWFDTHNPGGREPVYLAYFGTDSPEHYGLKARRLPSFPDWRRPDPVPLTPGYYAISASLFQGVYTAAFGPWCPDYERMYRATQRNFVIFDRAAPNSPERRRLFADTPPGFWDEQFALLEHLRFARLCAWLRQRGQPPHHVGHSIFIWKLDQAALDAAFNGPPPELEDRPGQYRTLP